MISDVVPSYSSCLTVDRTNIPNNLNTSSCYYKCFSADFHGNGDVMRSFPASGAVSDIRWNNIRDDRDMQHRMVPTLTSLQYSEALLGGCWVSKNISSEVQIGRRNSNVLFCPPCMTQYRLVSNAIAQFWSKSILGKSPIFSFISLGQCRSVLDFKEHHTTQVLTFPALRSSLSACEPLPKAHLVLCHHESWRPLPLIDWTGFLSTDLLPMQLVGMHPGRRPTTFHTMQPLHTRKLHLVLQL